MPFVTLTPGERAVTHLVSKEVPMEALTEALTTIKVGQKDGHAIIPARPRPCPTQCRNHGKKGFVDCGGGKLHRLSDNMEAMTGAVFDFDDTTDDEREFILGRFRARKVAFHYWETHGHNPPNDNRFRVAVWFEKELELPSADAWKLGAWPALCRWFGVEKYVDKACSDPARVYYTPRKPEPTDERQAFHWEPNDAKPALDVHALVDLTKFVKAQAVPVLPPRVDTSKPVDLEALKSSLKRVMKPGNKELIQNVLAGRALVPPPNRRSKEQPSRYVAWRTVCSILALHASEADATEALLSLLQPSWHAEYADDPEDHTKWATVEQLLESARAGAPQYKAKKEAERSATVDMFKTLLKERFPDRPEWDVTPTDEDEGEGETEENFSRGAEEEAGFDPMDAQRAVVDWHALLEVEVGKDGTPRVLNTYANLQLILVHSPPWRGMFRYNELACAYEIHRAPLLEPGETTRPIEEDRDVAATRILLELDPQFRLKPNWDNLTKAIKYAAKAQKYDPLKDYLHSLKWDGTRRLHRLYTHYMNAVCVDDDGKDLTALLETFATKWALSAVARGLIPGCKVDTMVHLEGAQGKNKSKALRILGGEFFASMQVDLANKDSFMLACTKWLIEMAELNQFKRADATLQKSFISQESDTYRPPYGQFLVTTGRRCTFNGTTNEQSYLSDATGHRRHWIVRIGAPIDTHSLQRDRDQLWAEAVQLFKEADSCDACQAAKERCDTHKWWLNDQDAESAEKQAEQSTLTDTMDEKVLEFYLYKEPNARSRFKYITVGEFASLAIKEDNPDKSLQMRITDTLRRMGFTKTYKMVDGQRAKRWEAPEKLMKAAQRKFHKDDVAERIGAATPEANA